jgi:hypothetical protein
MAGSNALFANKRALLSSWFDVMCRLANRRLGMFRSVAEIPVVDCSELLDGRPIPTNARRSAQYRYLAHALKFGNYPLRKQKAGDNIRFTLHRITSR